MEPTLNRRYQQDERVPLRIAIELGEGDFRDPFAADSLNLSKRGISMCSPCLPDVGSRLLCRFQCAEGAETLTAQGEVVWAQLDGKNSGEFGLAFIDLDPKTEWLLDELIAQHSANRAVDPESMPPEAEPSAPIAKLILEGSPEPIAARMASQQEGSAVFEQELDLLSLGRAVRAHALGIDGRTGSIAGVELRLVGNIPMLAVTVDFRGAGDYGEAELSQGDVVPCDTQQDLRSPVPAKAGRSFSQVTVTEFDAQAMLSEAAETEAEREAWGELVHDAPAVPSAPAEKAQAPQKASTIASESARADSDFSGPFLLDPRNAEHLAENALATPSVKALLVAVRYTLGVYARSVARTLQAATARALPHLRLAYVRIRTGSRASYADHVAPQLGALRRMLTTLLVTRRRRTTHAPGVARPGLLAAHGRSLTLGVFAACAVGLAVYALLPSASDGAVDLQRKVSASNGPAPAAAMAAPAVASAPLPASPRAVPDPEQVPSAKHVPPASPFAVDVRGGAASQAAKAPARTLRFGAAKVSRARRFALRMSANVQSLQGTSDAGGFSVVLMGSLSLDRAGPIRASVKAVDRAMIINRGDRAELSIRFAKGKHPAYQVSAEGDTVYVLIEDT